MGERKKGYIYLMILLGIGLIIVGTYNSGQYAYFLIVGLIIYGVGFMQLGEDQERYKEVDKLKKQEKWNKNYEKRHLKEKERLEKSAKKE